MKKILEFVILSGFVLMLGVAGSADVANMGFVKVLLLELLGVAIVLSGTSALMHYKRYVRRILLKKKRKNSNTLCKKTPVGVKIRLAKKELC
jgi:membrane protein implicated in regulation of membrane protease activity